MLKKYKKLPMRILKGWETANNKTAEKLDESIEKGVNQTKEALKEETGTAEAPGVNVMMGDDPSWPSDEPDTQTLGQEGREAKESN